MEKSDIENITTTELSEKPDEANENVVFVDLSEIDEYQSGHVEGMINVPLSTLKSEYNRIPKTLK